MTHTEEIVARLRSLGNESDRIGMSRFGIDTEKALGIRIPALRALASELKKCDRRGRSETEAANHALAFELWATEIHEARILASLLVSPERFRPEEMDHWSVDFHSWDLCDQCCMNLFRKTAFAYEKIPQYALSESEFVRRTAFSLLAGLAVGDKQSPDERFLPLLPLIERYSNDSRNFVCKAVNWSLRQIGKRSLRLHPEALALSQRLAASDNPTARWIGKDALRELTSPRIISRIH